MSVDAKKLAAALSAAGLNDRQVMAEVLMYLPEGFVGAYEKLWLDAFGTGAQGGKSPDGRVSVVKNQAPRTSSGTVDRIGGVGAGKKAVVPRDTVRSGRALSTKTWADRKLRSLAREINSRMSDDSDKNAPRRCAGQCKRWADVEWNYCPHCGGPTENVDLD